MDTAPPEGWFAKIADTPKIFGVTLHHRVAHEWRSVETPLREINPVPAMIDPDEQRYLHWLARCYYSGAGAIVDLGPGAGGSTYALASGLERNASVPEAKKVIHSYDLWEQPPGWDIYFPSFKVEVGGNNLPGFLANLGPMLRYVRPHRGDIREQRWRGGPVELIFVDIAKTSAAWTAVARQFLTRAIPGRTLLLLQDYISADCPWLHVFMDLYKDRFRMLDSPEIGTVSFLVTRPFRRSELRDNFLRMTAEECAPHYDAVAASFPGPHALHIELAKGAMALQKGRPDMAELALHRVRQHRLFDAAFLEFGLRYMEEGLKAGAWPGAQRGLRGALFGALKSVAMRLNIDVEARRLLRAARSLWRRNEGVRSSQGSGG